MKKALEYAESCLINKTEKYKKLMLCGKITKEYMAMLEYIVAAEKGQLPSFNHKKRVIRPDEVREFFCRASLFLNYIENRYRIFIPYHFYCDLIYLRYQIMSQYYGGQHVLSPSTVLSYFKRERAKG